MARNTTLSLGEHFERFIDRQVAGGDYDSAADVVRAGLRLLEERETALQALRSALIDGETSGAFEPFAIETFLAEMHEAADR
ncbi:type II toxin-antitoxin system ParD family antitoxin [Methylobacterium sp. SI9]|uniref:type II toxin-antitoxin system ParD family antitoxin n=1 Tax=Methylobacterium guangdongense TaxID=3138811 RepID=UPI00313B7CA0